MVLGLAIFGGIIVANTALYLIGSIF